MYILLLVPFYFGQSVYLLFYFMNVVLDLHDSQDYIEK